MKTTKPAKKTRQQLEREILEMKASLAASYHFANLEIGKCSSDNFMGSGILLQLSAIGGKELINPVLLRDGLSDETIAAIKRDLKYSYDNATLFKV